MTLGTIVIQPMRKVIDAESRDVKLQCGERGVQQCARLLSGPLLHSIALREGLGTGVG